MSLLLLLGFEGEGVTATPVAERYARMMTALLPPGKLWRLIGGSFLQSLFLGAADELERVETRVSDLLDEADPQTTVELLPEYEDELDLDPTGLSFGERRARVVARLVARQRFRPVDFQTALSPLLGQDPDDVVVIERTRAYAISVGDDREIYRFFIYRDPTLPGTYFLASAQALVDKIKPSHTVGQIVESIGFLYGDPHSLYGRDLMA